MPRESSCTGKVEYGSWLGRSLAVTIFGCICTYNIVPPTASFQTRLRFLRLEVKITPSILHLCSSYADPQFIFNRAEISVCNPHYSQVITLMNVRGEVIQIGSHSMKLCKCDSFKPVTFHVRISLLSTIIIVIIIIIIIIIVIVVLTFHCYQESIDSYFVKCRYFNFL